jgi:hypothetical protein
MFLKSITTYKTSMHRVQNINAYILKWLSTVSKWTNPTYINIRIHNFLQEIFKLQLNSISSYKLNSNLGPIERFWK